MFNKKKHPLLPYNPYLKARARELRKAGNLSEVLLWKQLNRKQFKGLDFDRQRIIGNYIVDFYCPRNGVIIEVDGVSHTLKEEYDVDRTEFLLSFDLKIIRINAVDILQNLDSVMKWLDEHEYFREINYPYPFTLEGELDCAYNFNDRFGLINYPYPFTLEGECNKGN